MRMWSAADDGVTGGLFWLGWDGYEPETARIFWDLATAAEVVVDVGAHVGYYTLLAAHANPDALVLAYEPMPYVLERLNANLGRNPSANVEVSSDALDAVSGEAELFHVGTDRGLPSASTFNDTFLALAGRPMHRLPVRTITLDEIVRTRGLRRMDLIKLDTETTERRILEGGRDTLRDLRPVVVCEVLTYADLAPLSKLLQDVGYTSELLTDRGPVARPVTAPSDRFRNFLLRPRP
jgi:FkbM family methyltransferase